MITVNMSLADVVKAFPGSTEIFNEYRIDYCCGGKDSLGAALEEKKLDPEEFIAKLNDKKEQHEANLRNRLNTSLYSLNVAELIDAIEETHHVDERDLLYKLDGLINKILIVHYEDHGEELLKVHRLFSALKMELEEHFIKEEQVVFPLMKQRETADENLSSLIKELEEEHDGAGEIIKELQAVTNDFQPPAGVCPTFILTYESLKTLINDIFLHIFSETSILFEKYA